MSMRRRDFIALLSGAAVAKPLAARAQQSAGYRIGHLALAAPNDSPPPPPANWNAFVQGLRETGLHRENGAQPRSCGQQASGGECRRRQSLKLEIQMEILKIPEQFKAAVNRMPT